jgi:high affinity Mn2+ porin
MIKTNRTSVCARLVGIGSCEESWACVLLVLVLYGLSAAPVAAQQSDPNLATPQREPESTDVASSPESMFPHFQSTRFWLSGQANFIFQTHPDFHSLYGGPHSLSSRYEKATSRVVTLFTGARVTNSLEFLVNIEESGGSALSDGFGLAGNTNLDIVRNPFLSKAPYLGRAEIHKVFALSGEKVENQRTAFSLFDELPRRRLELRFGKFSMPDFFDLNSVGSDTHFQFTNWTIDNNGAWDYAADTRGYTVGLVADYEDRTWGFRFAEALMPKVANGIDLVWKPWQSHAENFEYELRKGVLPGKPGIVRVLAYSNSANMGVYREQVVQAAGLGAAPDITAHPWRVTRKYGFGLNVEQNISRYLTGFARFGWNDGKTESFAYTEVDQTFNQGIGANGAWWHRKQDRAGVAFVSNAIKKDHQNYLEARGLGFLLGDGHLHYGRENILETYYTVHVWRGIYVAPGFQHIVNPGYNRDRGPVTVPTFRAHVEF